MVGLSSARQHVRNRALAAAAVAHAEYTGDQVVFPADVERSSRPRLPPTDARQRFRGDHHGQPLAPGEKPGRVQAGQAIREWLPARFPGLENAGLERPALSRSHQSE